MKKRIMLPPRMAWVISSCGECRWVKEQALPRVTDGRVFQCTFSSSRGRRIGNLKQTCAGIAEFCPLPDAGKEA